MIPNNEVMLFKATDVDSGQKSVSISNINQYEKFKVLIYNNAYHVSTRVEIDMKYNFDDGNNEIKNGISIAYPYDTGSGVQFSIAYLTKNSETSAIEISQERYINIVNNAISQGQIDRLRILEIIGYKN